MVAHALAVITVQAGVGRCLAGKCPEEASSALGSIEAISRTAQDELRVVLGLLRDGEAGIVPLAPVPRLIDVKDLADTVRASGVPVELRMEGTDRRLSPSLELSVYRVVQESLAKVLVVDDEALLRSAFCSLIEAQDDLEVAGAAADGRQAVELAASLAPDVVVMDVRMPVMDGIEATRRITHTPGLPDSGPACPHEETRCT